MGVIDGKEIYVGNQKLFSKLKIEEKYKQGKKKHGRRKEIV